MDEADPPDAALHELFAYQEHLRTLAPADASREAVRLISEPASPATTVKAALALGATHSPGDIARALGLLDPLLRATDIDSAPWQPMARLLAARYGDQRRLEEQIDRQNQAQRDLQRRLDQVNEKLDALKAIERSMSAHPGAASAPKR